MQTPERMSSFFARATLPLLCAAALGIVSALGAASPQMAVASTRSKTPAKVAIKSSRLWNGKLTVKVKKTKRAKAYEYQATVRDVTKVKKTKKRHCAFKFDMTTEKAKVKARAWNGKRHGVRSKTKKVAATAAGGRGGGTDAQGGSGESGSKDGAAASGAAARLAATKTLDGVTCEAFRCADGFVVARFTNGGDTDVAVEAELRLLGPDGKTRYWSEVSIPFIEVGGGQGYGILDVPTDEGTAGLVAGFGSVTVRDAVDGERFAYATHLLMDTENADGTIGVRVVDVGGSIASGVVRVVFLDSRGDPVWCETAFAWGGRCNWSESVPAPPVEYASYVAVMDLWV